MAKYIDLPNLKENLTNFLNKKINPIYAKKIEIPSNVSELNNDKSYQTAEEVGQAVTDGVARIVAGAPEDFDTLKEMSDWISSHETSAAAMNSAISDNSIAIANHTSNSDIHVTKAEKIKWNKLDSDLKDGTIIVAEATKATQDAKGNVIDTTYAKKTEIPQGTIVDDALSSTSTNPVQNKVVKAEFDQVKNDLNVVFNTREIDAPRCVLTDNKNTITSDYGYSYSDITNMLINGDWRKYIKNGDYIRLTTLNNEVFNLIFNINTYKDYGDTSVGSHIDLISEHLISSSQRWQMRTENTNNGTVDNPNPFLASTNMIDKLSTYFTDNIPDGLKSHIVTKRLLAPKRYSDSGTLTDDNGWDWKDLGKMWLPFEQEVTGRQVWGSREYQGGLRWYPCFQDGTQLTKRLGENGDRSNWWTASAYSGNSTNFVNVSTNGTINNRSASHTWLAVPLCMRFK